MMLANNFLADGQTDPRARIYIVIMKSLKYRKYFIFVFRTETNAIVPDGKDAKFFIGERIIYLYSETFTMGNFNLRRDTCLYKF